MCGPGPSASSMRYFRRKFDRVETVLLGEFIDRRPRWTITGRWAPPAPSCPSCRSSYPDYPSVRLAAQPCGAPGTRAGGMLLYAFAGATFPGGSSLRLVREQAAGGLPTGQDSKTSRGLECCQSGFDLGVVAHGVELFELRVQ